MSQPSKCRTCGKAEWGHVCAGAGWITIGAAPRSAARPSAPAPPVFPSAPAPPVLTPETVRALDDAAFKGIYNAVWGPGRAVSITMSSDLSPEAVYAIREITVLAKGGIRFKFHDRRAALMDLARLRGMITDKSASFHFHEDLARMSPDDQKRRVAELLEFAASIKVPGDSAVDVTPDHEEEIED